EHGFAIIFPHIPPLDEAYHLIVERLEAAQYRLNVIIWNIIKSGRQSYRLFGDTSWVIFDVHLLLVRALSTILVFFRDRDSKGRFSDIAGNLTNGNWHALLLIKLLIRS